MCINLNDRILVCEEVASVEENLYLHTLKPTHILSTHLWYSTKSYTNTHPQTSIHAHTHPLLHLSLKVSLKLKSNWQRWAANVFIRWRPLPLTVLIHPSGTHFTEMVDTPLPPSPSSISPFFYVDTDVQDLTHCEWAQMAPIAARQSEQGDHNPPDCRLIHMCVQYI